MLRPPAWKQAAMKDNRVEPPFPVGSIGFLNAISAIGTKFQQAKQMGPQSKKSQSNGEQISGTLLFDFNR